MKKSFSQFFMAAMFLSLLATAVDYVSNNQLAFQNPTQSVSPQPMDGDYV